MLLAAGLGTRLRPATLLTPKPSLELVNIPLLAYPWRLLEVLKPTRLVVNCHHLSEKVKATAMRLSGRPEDLVCLDEQPQILGSGGGIRNARSHLGGAGYFAVANGDEVFFPNDSTVLKRMFEGCKQNKWLAALLTTQHPEAGSRFGAVWVDEQDFVLGFGRNPITSHRAALHFTGFMVLSDEVFNYMPQDKPDPNILYDVLASGIADGKKVVAVSEPGLWLEVGNSSEFLKGSRILLGQLRSRSQSGILDLASKYWSDYREREDVRFPKGFLQGFGRPQELQGMEHLLIGQGAQLKVNSHLADHIVLGENSVVEARCELIETIVQPYSQVPQGARLKSEIWVS